MKISFLTSLTFLSCVSILSAEDDAVLVPHARGIILTADPVAPSLNVHGVAVIDLELPGNRKSLEKRLLPLFMEKALTMEDVVAIKREIILYYRDHDRLIVDVHIPEQDVTDGVLTFQIMEGKLGEITVQGNHYFSTELIRNYIDLKPGDPIDDRTLTNDLAFINRNPFRHADLVYSAGKEIGTTNLELFVRDHLPLRTFIGTDNTGVKATGRLRYYTGFNWGKVFGLDHILSFQYTTSSDFYKFQGYTLSYNALLPWKNILLLYGGYSTTHVRLCKGTCHKENHKHTETKGISGQASMRYGIPLKPKNYLLHELHAGYDFKRSNNSIESSGSDPTKGSLSNLTQFVFEYTFGYERKSQKIGFDIEVFFSPFTWVPDQSKNDFQTLNPHAKPKYIYSEFAFDYALNLPANFILKFFLEGQVASGSLLPSEQFGLGGYDTVRGYNERALNSDEGLLITTEIWSPTFSPSYGILNDTLQFLLFFDYGLAHDIHAFEGIKQTDWIMGIGPGLRYAIGSNLSARLDMGFKLHRINFDDQCNKFTDGGIGMAHFAVIASY